MADEVAKPEGLSISESFVGGTRDGSREDARPPPRPSLSLLSVYLLRQRSSTKTGTK